VQARVGGTDADRDQALCLLGVKSGFRISELWSLRLGEVSQHGRLVDRVTVPRRQMKNTREGRTVRLHPETKATRATWLLTVRQDPSATVQTCVLRSRKVVNRPISKGQAWRILHEAETANELTGKVGTHAMRKTFANRVYHQHRGVFELHRG
jgi:integrase